jgi:hypothetical protein
VNWVNSGGKQVRKVMEETIADNGIGSRHVEMESVKMLEDEQRRGWYVRRRWRRKDNADRIQKQQVACDYRSPNGAREQQSKTWWKADIPIGSQRAELQARAESNRPI